MNLKRPLSINCYVMDDAQIELLSLGVESSPDILEEATFYNIDCIEDLMPVGGDKKLGFIMSGGNEYATCLSYKELKELISKHI